MDRERDFSVWPGDLLPIFQHAEIADVILFRAKDVCLTPVSVTVIKHLLQIESVVPSEL